MAFVSWIIPLGTAFVTWTSPWLGDVAISAVVTPVGTGNGKIGTAAIIFVEEGENKLFLPLLLSWKLSLWFIVLLSLYPL